MRAQSEASHEAQAPHPHAKPWYVCPSKHMYPILSQCLSCSGKYVSTIPATFRYDHACKWLGEELYAVLGPMYSM